MKTSKLYNLLDLKPYIQPPKIKITIIFSEEAEALFKTAKLSIEQNHINTHSVQISDKSINKYNEGKVVSKTYFKNSTNPEMLRGMTIDKLIIDETVSKEQIKYVKDCIGPAAKEIIILDKEG